MKNINIRYTPDLLKEMINKSTSFKELLCNIGITKGGPQAFLRKKIKEFNIDISHLTLERKRSKGKMFVVNSTFDRSTIRSRIIKQDLIKYECQLCQNKGEWLGQKMPLILDHINGINDDYRLENLRWLCSNCDSIQPTYKARNKKISSNKEKIINIQEKENLLLEEKTKTINLILNSNIDLNKRGYGVKLSKYLKWSPQYTLQWVKKNMNNFIVR